MTWEEQLQKAADIDKHKKILEAIKTTLDRRLNEQPHQNENALEVERVEIVRDGNTLTTIKHMIEEHLKQNPTNVDSPTDDMR